jgi:hypothetical protein
MYGMKRNWVFLAVILACTLGLTACRQAEEIPTPSPAGETNAPPTVDL